MSKRDIARTALLGMTIFQLAAFYRGRGGNPDGLGITALVEAILDHHMPATFDLTALLWGDIA
jgi:hypothetical protein